MKDGHCNIWWFDGDAVPKIADVVPQCKSKLIKISKILKQIATNFNLLFNFWFAQKSHVTEAKFFQADNSQLKYGNI